MKDDDDCANPKGLGFVWVLQNIWRPHQNEPLAVRIPDCLVALESFGVSNEAAWLFTSRQGSVLKHAEKTVGGPLPQAFASACSQRGGNITVYYASGEAETTHAHRMPEILQDFGDDVLAICQDPPSDPDANHRIEARFRLDANGLTHSLKLSQREASRRKEIDSIADRLARHLARNTGSRVQKMKLVFALDASSSKLWLVRVSDVRLAPEKTLTGPTREASRASKSQRRCAGSFCQYNEDAQRAWMRRELPLDPSSAPREVDDPALLQGQQLRSSLEMHKIPYRSVLLGQEPQTLDMMDPLLRVWTLRQRASQSRLKSFTSLTFAQSLAHRRGVTVVPQDATVALDWQWTGSIGFVDIKLVAHQDDAHVMLARGCRNTGRVRLHVPMLCPDWASAARPWKIIVSDALDDRVSLATPVVALGGPNGEAPTIPRHWSSLSSAQPFTTEPKPLYSFADPQNLSSYHKTASVCSTCHQVYERLTTARIERGEASETSQDPVSTQNSGSQDRLHQPADDDQGEAPKFLPVLARPAPVESARSSETRTTLTHEPQRRDNLRRTQSADAFFARLAAPKRASAKEGDFQEARTWGAGFNLRKDSSASAKARRARRRQSRRLHRHQSAQDMEERHLRRHRERQLRALQRAEKAKASVQDERVEQSSHHSVPHPYSSSLRRPHGKSRKSSKKHVKSRDKTTYKTRDRDMATEELRIDQVSQASDLFEVLCVLALGREREMRSCKQLVESPECGLAGLCAAHVKDGNVCVSAHSVSISAESRTINLVRKYFAVCEIFVELVGGKNEAREFALEKYRVEDAASTLDELATVYHVALSRARMMRGLAAELRGDSRHACEQWRLAVADAARLEGMWCYNVGVAHLLLSRSMKEDPCTGSHASAAAAIFRRLGEDLQEGNNNDDEEETKKSAHLGNGENGDEDEDNVEPNEDEDEDEDDEERAALLRWAKRAIERVESTLHDRGRRKQAPRSPAEKDVWRLVDAARADMKIFSETRAGDTYFGHRRGRVKDAIELLETRMASLFTQGQGSSSSRSNNSGSSSSNSVYSSGPSEDEVEDEDEDEDDEDEDEEWSRYGPSATSKELFRLCRARDAKALEREFKRNPDIVRHAADTAGNTILHAAASDNWIDGVHICLSAGANIDARNLNGDTPMDLATSAVRTLLIALGAAS